MHRGGILITVHILEIAWPIFAEFDKGGHGDVSGVVLLYGDIAMGQYRSVNRLRAFPSWLRGRRGLWRMAAISYGVTAGFTFRDG